MKSKKFPCISTSLSRRAITMIASVLLIAFVFAGIMNTKVFAVEPTDSSGKSINALNPYTKQNILQYVTALMKVIGGSGDPLHPDQQTIKKIQGVLDFINNGNAVIIVYNGNICSNFNTVGVADEGQPVRFFIKPLGIEVKPTQYLEIISQEKINPDDFYKNIKDPVRSNIKKMFLELVIAGNTGSGKTPNPITPEFTAKVNSYMDEKVREGILTSFNYDSKTDTLEFTFKGEEIPWTTQPLLEAYVFKYVIDAYANPQDYAKITGLEYRSRLKAGEVLLVNTEGKNPFHDFMSRQLLKDHLAILADSSLSADEKINRIAGGMKFQELKGNPRSMAPPFQKQAGVISGNNPKKSGLENPSCRTAFDLPTFLTGFFGSLPAPSTSGGSQQLLDREGVIVPPSKNIAYIRCADYVVPSYLDEHIFNKQCYEMNQIQGQDGVFSIFHKNGYQIRFYSAGWEERIVEKIANVLNDDSVSVIYYKAHGSTKKLLAEIFELGDEDYQSKPATLDQGIANLKSFKSRVMGLRSRFGDDSIKVYFTDSVISEEDRNILLKKQAQLPQHLRSLAVKRKKLAGIVLTDSFFKSQCKKKSLFILRSCYGGSMADSIRARVILAPDAKSFTTESMFIGSDLRKIMAYIFKNQNPGSLKITKENLRNFNIVRDFKKPPAWSEDLSPAVESQMMNSCSSAKDQLCSIILYGENNQSVSPSPHVEEVNGEKIVFNAPMDNSVDVNSVVTIEVSFPQGLQEGWEKLKPKWINDKEISLPWTGKVYREWKEDDFSGDGSPNTAYAKIIVHSRNAVSKQSRIQLTGNDDGCNKNGAKVKECWRDPALVKYNGNKPSTDFVFFLPLVLKKPVELPPSVADDYMGKILYTEDRQNLICDGKKIIDHDKSWEEHNNYREYPNPVPVYTLENEEMAVFADNMAYVKQTECDTYSPKRYNEIIYNGSPIYKGEDHITGLQLYGNSKLYCIEEQKTRKKTQYYNGTPYDPEAKGYGVMTTTALFSVNDKNQLFKNGQMIGVTGVGRKIHEGDYRDQYTGGTMVFKDNAGFIGIDNRPKFYLSKSNKLMDMGEMGDGHNYYMFGDHFVYQKRAVFQVSKIATHSYYKIIYDGKDMGPGESPILFGDHLAFITSSNPATGKGPCYEADPMIGRKGKGPHYMFNRRYIYFDGKYYDIEKQLQLSSDHEYDIFQPMIFDNHLAFALVVFKKGAKERESLRFIYDWKDTGELSGNAVLFGNNYAYTRESGNKHHVIYNGSDLGEGESPVLYKNHIAFSTKGGGKVHYDGREYSSLSSIIDNMKAAYRYFMENNVPYSAYGTVKFLEKGGKKGK